MYMCLCYNLRKAKVLPRTTTGFFLVDSIYVFVSKSYSHYQVILTSNLTKSHYINRVIKRRFFM